MKKYYWGEYDLDGSFEFYVTNDKNTPTHYSHLLGPFRTFGEAKREVISALKFCRVELALAIANARSKKKPC